MEPLLAVLDGTLRVSLLFAAAWVVDLLLRRRAARLRHLAWCAAVVGALLVPLNRLAFFELDLLPRRVPAAAGAGPASLAELEARLEEPPRVAASGPVAAPQEGLPAGAADLAPRELPRRLRRPRGEAPPAPLDLARGAALLWTLGLVAGLAWLVVGRGRVSALARRARGETDPALLTLLARTARRIGLARPVRLARSAEVATPMTFGLARPTVLLPADVAGWSRERCEIVLLHELAHVRRRDWLWQSIAQLARSVWWFHPLAWLAYRRMADERERACDEAVLACGATPSVYASHLLAIALELPRDRRLPAAALTLAHRSKLEGRLMSILQDPRSRRGSALFVPLVGVLSSAVLFVSCLRTFVSPDPAGPAASPAPAAQSETRAPRPAPEPDAERLERLEALLRRVEALEERLHPREGRPAPTWEPREPWPPSAPREPWPTFAPHEPFPPAAPEPLGHEPPRPGARPDGWPLPPQDLDRLHEGLETYRRRIDELHERLEPTREDLRRLQEEMGPLHRRLLDVDEELSRRRVPEGARPDEESLRRGFERLREIEDPLGRRGVDGDERLGRELEDVRRELEARRRATPSPREAPDPARERAELDEHLSPLHERLEALSRELEPLQRQMDELQRAMRPRLEELDRLHERLQPMEDPLQELDGHLRPPLERSEGPHRRPASRWGEPDDAERPLDGTWRQPDPAWPPSGRAARGPDRDDREVRGLPLPARPFAVPGGGTPAPFPAELAPEPFPPSGLPSRSAPTPDAPQDCRPGAAPAPPAWPAASPAPWVHPVPTLEDGPAVRPSPAPRLVRAPAASPAPPAATREN